MIRTLFILLFVGPVLLTAQRDTFLEVEAEKGDGIFSLLDRYNFDGNTCVREKFCELNKMTLTDHLIIGKSYKIPIMMYAYNGKSIRSTIGNDNWDLAKKIERFNDLMFEVGRKKADYRKNTKILWVPYHYLACKEEKIDLTPRNRHFPIFGEKEAHIPLKDERLKGAVYYLVSGHGGPDPGAMAKYKNTNLCEDEYAYDITLRLAKNLIASGALVYMIVRDPNDGIRNAELLPSDNDERCWKDQVIPLDQKQRLQQRSRVINQLYKRNKSRGADYQRVVEIHIDSRNRNKGIDLFFYHHPKNNRAKKLAEKIHRVMKDKYAKHRRSGEYHGEVLSRDLHMLREVKPTPVFVEVGNIQNKNDQKRILYSSNRQALADWLFEGLLKDY